MGWSEKYWEDVKSELEQSATESEPPVEDDTLDQPTVDQPLDATRAELRAVGPLAPGSTA